MNINYTILTKNQCSKNYCKICFVILVIITGCLFLFVSNEQYNKLLSHRNALNYFQYTFKSTVPQIVCQKRTTLREYCSKILQCQTKDVMYISTDISMLNQSIQSPTIQQNFTINKSSYILSKEFFKFKSFHQSTNFPISVHLLDHSTFVVRVPVLDTQKYPNNNSNYVYMYPRSNIHWSQQSNLQRFDNRTYTTGTASQFQAAFFIVHNAIANSADGNILVQTCSRAITVIGCSSSNTSARLQSQFPYNTKTNLSCSINSTDTNINIISVNKLLILAHTWYNAYYHLTMEAMSRLMIIHELLIFDSQINILIQYPIYKNTAKQLFQLFGIDENRIIYFSSADESSTLFRAETIFIPTGIACGGPPLSLLEQISVKGLNPSKIGIIPPKPYVSIPLPIVHIANQTTQNLPLDIFRVKTGPIVIVSRGNRIRSIENQDDILKFLAKEYSTIPVIIFHSNMSLTDTIALFHSARILITPHGAGQSHILWMRPGTAMLEISSPHRYNCLYQPIAFSRQIDASIVFDSLTTGKSTLQVNMSIFQHVFKQLIHGRY